MNDEDPTSPVVEAPQVPDHLQPALRAAAKEELEFACDGDWPHDEGEYDARLDRVAQAVDAIRHWATGTCTREEVAKMAAVAIDQHEPGRWPRTIDEAEVVLNAATLTRDLILLRDELGRKPSQES